MKIPSSLPTLHIAAPPARGSFLLAGEKASILVRADQGAGTIRFPPLHRVEFEYDLPYPNGVHVSPGLVRRVLPVGPGYVIESVLAFRRLPAALVHWEAVDGARFEVSVRWKAVGGPIRLRFSGGSEATLEPGTARSWSHPLVPSSPVVVLLSPVDLPELTAKALGRRLRDPTGELRSWSEPYSTPSAGGADDPVRVHVESDARAPASDRIGGGEPWLGTDTDRHPIEDVGAASALVLSHLEGSASWATGRGDSDAGAALTGLGLLAAGLHERATELIDRRLRAPQPDDPAGLLELVARHSLWTGSSRFLDSVPTSLVGQVTDADALGAWIDALEDGGRDGVAAELRPRLKRIGSSEVPGGRVRPGRCSDIASTGPHLALEAWSRWQNGNAEEGWILWRAALERAVFGDPLEPDLDRPSTAGALWAALLFGALGARAHAAFGRLVLAPRIPRSWRRAAVRGIRIADARVTLSYQGSGGRHTFELEPREGRIPLNLVFRPRVAAGQIGKVTVDGETADVERTGGPGNRGIRLQLALDRTRTLVLHEKA